MTQLMISI